jgi:hypothetical protein
MQPEKTSKLSVFLALCVLLLPGCVNHPSYWSEESCEYCIKQNEHYTRVYKDEMVKARLKRIESDVKKLKRESPGAKTH